MRVGRCGLAWVQVAVAEAETEAADTGYGL